MSRRTRPLYLSAVLLRIVGITFRGTLTHLPLGLNRGSLTFAAPVRLRLPSHMTSRFMQLPLARGYFRQSHRGLTPPTANPCPAHVETSPSSSATTSVTTPTALAHP